MNIIDHLLQENIAILPTDTVYGLSCIHSQIAINKIYDLKKRNKKKLLVRVYHELSSVLTDRSVILNDTIISFMKNHLPGPFTIISLNNIGIRIPNHSQVLDIIKNINQPIYMTSVNISGNNPINSIQEMKNTFPDIPIVISNVKISHIPSRIIQFQDDKIKYLR